MEEIRELNMMEDYLDEMINSAPSEIDEIEDELHDEDIFSKEFNQ